MTRHRIITIQELRSSEIRSRGPRTAAGKARSSRNAHRHGLSISIWRDQKLAGDAEALAHEIAGSNQNDDLLAWGRRIAEAQIDLVRIRDTRKEILQPTLDRSTHWLRKPSKRLPSRRVLETCVGPPSREKLALVINDLSDDLESLDRYERRALSRRNSAIHAFCAARWRQLAQGGAPVRDEATKN